jgi:DNA-binding transcriptional MerR regulator
VAEYRIDDLARVAGASVRNVRVYQDRGLLPPPIRRGRTAIYTDAHLSRLRLVTNMLGRGYTFAQIKEMLAAWQAGQGLGDVLGFEAAMGAPWTEELPTPITLAELRELYGSQLTEPALARAVELGVLERRGDEFVAPSRGLLEAGRELVRLGVPLAEAIELAGELQRGIDHLTALLVGLVRDYVLDARGPGWLPEGEELPHYVDLLKRLPPLVNSALSAAVARSTSRVIPEIVGDRLVALLARGERDADTGHDQP